MPQIKQKKENRTRTREVEERKGKTLDQAPENRKKTDVIEELKRKQGRSS